MVYSSELPGHYANKSTWKGWSISRLTYEPCWLPNSWFNMKSWFVVVGKMIVLVQAIYSIRMFKDVVHMHVAAFMMLHAVALKKLHLAPKFLKLTEIWLPILPSWSLMLENPGSKIESESYRNKGVNLTSGQCSVFLFIILKTLNSARRHRIGGKSDGCMQYFIYARISLWMVSSQVLSVMIYKMFLYVSGYFMNLTPESTPFGNWCMRVGF